MFRSIRSLYYLLYDLTSLECMLARWLAHTALWLAAGGAALAPHNEVAVHARTTTDCGEAAVSVPHPQDGTLSPPS